MKLTWLFAAVAVSAAACSSSSTGTSATSGDDSGTPPPDDDASSSMDASPVTDGSVRDAPADRSEADVAEASAPCTTRVTYGSAWIHGANHPASYDDASGKVTWDGTCTDDGANSYATLSNGWKPYFQGNGACIMALDYTASCGVPATCTTRVSYGSAWLPPPNHPATYDDVAGRVFSDGVCHQNKATCDANLSNGWQPNFSGMGTCRLSFMYTQCGGLYANPVIPVDCPDPGVLSDGAAGGYVLSCTSGNAANAYPMYTSPDLATWTPMGHIFPSGHWPSWAKSDFWAPEVHKVGSHYVAYFSARDTDGMLSVGAASATSPLGPFTDVGQPLVHDTTMGHIDASEITDASGKPYLIWKDDGNAIGQHTPIHAQPLAADGLSLTGSPTTLITNDEAWEGAVTEGPWMVQQGGSYYLFYSGNAYNTSAYAIGVASAPSPLGPFTKAGAPILVTGGAWAGPGHCSVIDTPAGDTYVVYHAWEASAVGGGPGRLVLTDAIHWDAQSGWPSVPLAPSSNSRPLP
ncbi:MAG TPA: glycoside hydrolase family 43 protein [Polyangiaceae bacterium]